eukprot:snap_masked-scaffold_45-processed-gene-1.95-mRNA-1 protein AED:1.00 eAED:1.00 QI:0/0/0/0/1/1/2/0/80
MASPTLIICLVLFFGVQRIPNQSSVFEVRRDHPALILGDVVEWAEEGSNGSRCCKWVSRRFTVSFSKLFSGFCELEVVGS